MILERQVELLILNQLAEGLSSSDLARGIADVDGITYDLVAMSNRTDELIKEFLSPYVIDTAPKGD